MGKSINVKYLGFDDTFVQNGTRFQLKGMEYNVNKSFNVVLHVVNIDRNVSMSLETTTYANVMLQHAGRE